LQHFLQSTFKQSLLLVLPQLGALQGDADLRVVVVSDGTGRPEVAVMEAVVLEKSKER
jgi:hypothetical protein